MRNNKKYPKLEFESFESLGVRIKAFSSKISTVLKNFQSGIEEGISSLFR